MNRSFITPAVDIASEDSLLEGILDAEEEAVGSTPPTLPVSSFEAAKREIAALASALAQAEIDRTMSSRTNMKLQLQKTQTIPASSSDAEKKTIGKASTPTQSSTAAAASSSASSSASAHRSSSHHHVLPHRIRSNSSGSTSSGRSIRPSVSARLHHLRAQQQQQSSRNASMSTSAPLDNDALMAALQSPPPILEEGESGATSSSRLQNPTSFHLQQQKWSTKSGVRGVRGDGLEEGSSPLFGSTSAARRGESPMTPAQLSTETNPSSPEGANKPDSDMTEEDIQSLAKDRQKKDNHNQIERKRRYHINDRIKELGTIIPGTSPLVTDSRTSKGKILQASVQYIRELQTEQAEKKEMRERLEELELQNRAMKSRLDQIQQVANASGIDLSRLSVSGTNGPSPTPRPSTSSPSHQHHQQQTTSTASAQAPNVVAALLNDPRTVTAGPPPPLLQQPSGVKREPFALSEHPPSHRGTSAAAPLPPAQSIYASSAPALSFMQQQQQQQHHQPNFNTMYYDDAPMLDVHQHQNLDDFIGVPSEHPSEMLFGSGLQQYSPLTMMLEQMDTEMAGEDVVGGGGMASNF